MRDLSVYIHIPFCLQKCLYCDFLSFSHKDEQYEVYKNALINEIKAFDSCGYIVKSIFIGGGTPSVLPAEFIHEIMNAVLNKFTLNKNTEITIESNPKILNKNNLTIYKNCGINRLSIGLQAWQDNLLNLLGRVHSKDDFIKNYLDARAVGFENINVDLMFSLPNQTLKDWTETLENVISLKPDHISAYSLIVEEGTPFFDKFSSNEFSYPSDEEDRQMYYKAKEFLLQNSFNQYEISNFSASGKKCFHNITYWKRREYIGFGLGAHSFIENSRFSNTTDFDKYISGSETVSFKEELKPSDSYSEFMFLGLRMNEGIKCSDFQKAFNKNIYDIYSNEISKLKNLGLLAVSNDNIRLTEKGIDLSNQVFVEFIP